MMSTIVDYTDRTTCVLFGDGAAAVMIEPTTEDIGVIDTELKINGIGGQYLNIKAGGSLKPTTAETIANRENFLYQDGQNVFKFAVKSMADAAEAVMKRNNLTGDDIAWLVPHQANKRIIDATAHRAVLTDDKVMLNIQKYGNTTAATIPLCLWDWEKKLKKGDNLILAAFGGGFTWGSIYLKWGYDTK
jgi:3-oxoacyl-[acyl-carrier-protein] synthase-3